MKKLFLLLGLATFLQASQAIELDVTDWSCELAEAGVQNAGDYYPSELQPGDTATLTCTNATASITGLINNTDSWSLTARLASALSGMTLEIKRDGPASTGNPPTGGNDFITLTTASQAFFSGTGNTEGIPLTFRISNFDVNDGYSLNQIDIDYVATETP
jgi:hypothetical protein